MTPGDEQNLSAGSDANARAGVALAIRSPLGYCGSGSSKIRWFVGSAITARFVNG
jgi:hypothetical protein